MINALTHKLAAWWPRQWTIQQLQALDDLGTKREDIFLLRGRTRTLLRTA